MTSSNTLLTQRCATRYFGPVEYDEPSVLRFPDGIPAFEQDRRFLIVRQPVSEPLVFLQSLEHQDVCFATLPAPAARQDFQLNLAPEDLDALGLDTGRQPALGSDVLCLAILSITENAPPTVNLLAPVVVNLRTLCARQAIQVDSPYSHQEPLLSAEAVCS